ncbi:MAG: DUF502 domain-containing protein [Rhodobacteraceae bacterium]|nr:DUF502 domain-containing protein [Paracoccaceae bacterium]
MNDTDERPVPKPHPPGLFGRMRGYFLTGLIVVAPVSLTAYFIWAGVGIIDNWVLPLVPRAYHPSNYLGVDIRGFGLIIFLVFTIFVGWMTRGLIGRTLVSWGERIVDRMPIVRSIYSGLKQIAETVFSQTEAKFERACLLEYPRPGIWVIAFVSTRARGEIAEKVPRDDEVISIFLPTTPNPTSGFLLFLPRREVILLDMSVEEAAKLVISAGLVYPQRQPDGTVIARPAA